MRDAALNISRLNRFASPIAVEEQGVNGLWMKETGLLLVVSQQNL